MWHLSYKLRWPPNGKAITVAVANWRSIAIPLISTQPSNKAVLYGTMFQELVQSFFLEEHHRSIENWWNCNGVTFGNVPQHSTGACTQPIMQNRADGRVHKALKFTSRPSPTHASWFSLWMQRRVAEDTEIVHVQEQRTDRKINIFYPEWLSREPLSATRGNCCPCPSQGWDTVMFHPFLGPLDCLELCMEQWALERLFAVGFIRYKAVM